MFKSIFFILFWNILFLFSKDIFGQIDKNYTKWVHPFIGTGDADAFTFWGKQGGTYPGAVAPWGYVQISPENKATLDEKGYNYNTKNILYFTLNQHLSGYPDGASGKSKIMFYNSLSPLSHSEISQQELAKQDASPGYYHAQLKNGIDIQIVALSHSGIFNIHFDNKTPIFWIGQKNVHMSRDTLRWVEGADHFVLICPAGIQRLKSKALGSYFTANPSYNLIFKFGVSQVSFSNAIENLTQEIASDTLEALRYKVNKQWNDVLARIEVKNSNDSAKLIQFYTAIYHSCLLPWKISDKNGQFLGADNHVHYSSKTQFGIFSAWDTYRTLHPFLTWIFPELQFEICQSLMEQYKQTGRLPGDPMVGHHIAIVLVDTYLKGLEYEKSSLLKKALLDLLAQDHSESFGQYQLQGWVSSKFKESVSQSLAYSIDDYYIGRFLDKIGDKDADFYLNRSKKAQILRDRSRKVFLPMDAEGTHIQNPTTFGYKEADMWNSSYDMYYWPQIYGQDTIEKTKLNQAWNNGLILLDNETAFHIPYMYGLIGAQKQMDTMVSRLLKNRFSNSAGGLCGNDDLGSLSSWLIWAHLGLYPLNNMQGDYLFHRPSFDSVLLHLPGNRSQWLIANKNMDNKIVASKWLKHQQLTRLDTLFLLPSENIEDSEKLARIALYSSDEPEELDINAFFKLSKKDLNTHVDLISQGDWNVLQMTNNRFLTFFAGGWGRGTATISLKSVYYNKWYKVSCHYKKGRLIITLNGKILFQQNIQPITKIKNSMPWKLYGNYEFPNERQFHGKLKNIKVIYNNKVLLSQ